MTYLELIAERLASPSLYSGNDPKYAILQIKSKYGIIGMERQFMKDLLWCLRAAQDGVWPGLAPSNPVYVFVVNVLAAMIGVHVDPSTLSFDLDTVSALIEADEYEKARVVLDAATTKYGAMIGAIMGMDSKLWFIEEGDYEDVTDDPSD
jgi:hypothetical protein